MPVIFIRHDGPAGSPLAPSSAGWQLHDTLNWQAQDRVLAKRASDAFCRTTLHAILEADRVDQLWICGYASDFCVDSTVRSAAMQGYAVTVIADAHTCKPRPHVDAVPLRAHLNWLWAHLDTPGAPVQVRSLIELEQDHLASC